MSHTTNFHVFEVLYLQWYFFYSISVIVEHTRSQSHQPDVQTILRNINTGPLTSKLVMKSVSNASHLPCTNTLEWDVKVMVFQDSLHAGEPSMYLTAMDAGSWLNGKNVHVTSTRTHHSSWSELHAVNIWTYMYLLSFLWSNQCIWDAWISLFQMVECKEFCGSATSFKFYVIFCQMSILIDFFVIFYLMCSKIWIKTIFYSWLLYSFSI